MAHPLFTLKWDRTPAEPRAVNSLYRGKTHTNKHKCMLLVQNMKREYTVFTMIT